MFFITQLCWYKSMVILNFSNVEKMIFQDREIQKILPPNMFSYFEQWRLGKQMPFLKQIGKAAMLDFLNNLNDEHISILEDYFGERVMVERLNYNIAMNIEISLEDANEVCQKLCEIEGDFNYGTWRDEKKLYISFWR